MRMRFTKRGKAFVVRNVYTHVKTDWVNRDKAVLPDFACPEIPKNVAPIQKLQGAFYAIGTLDASTVFWTQTMSTLIFYHCSNYLNRSAEPIRESGFVRTFRPLDLQGHSLAQFLRGRNL